MPLRPGSQFGDSVWNVTREHLLIYIPGVSYRFESSKIFAPILLPTTQRDSFFLWGMWVSEKFNNLVRIPQLVSDGSGFEPTSFWQQNPCSLHFCSVSLAGRWSQKYLSYNLL